MKAELEKLLESLNKQYKDVYTLKVFVDEDKELVGFFRKPTFNEFRMIYPLFVKGDDLMADRRLLETCWLGGDEELVKVDENIDIFLSIRTDLGKIIELKASSLKKN